MLCLCLIYSIYSCCSGSFTRTVWSLVGAITLGVSGFIMVNALCFTVDSYVCGICCRTREIPEKLSTVIMVVISTAGKYLFVFYFIKEIYVSGIGSNVKSEVILLIADRHSGNIGIEEVNKSETVIVCFVLNTVCSAVEGLCCLLKNVLISSAVSLLIVALDNERAGDILIKVTCSGNSGCVCSCRSVFAVISCCDSRKSCEEHLSVTILVNSDFGHRNDKLYVIAYICMLNVPVFNACCCGVIVNLRCSLITFSYTHNVEFFTTHARTGKVETEVYAVEPVKSLQSRFMGSSRVEDILCLCELIENVYIVLCCSEGYVEGAGTFRHAVCRGNSNSVVICIVSQTVKLKLASVLCCNLIAVVTYFVNKAMRRVICCTQICG